MKLFLFYFAQIHQQTIRCTRNSVYTQFGLHTKRREKCFDEEQHFLQLEATPNLHEFRSQYDFKNRSFLLEKGARYRKDTRGLKNLYKYHADSS